jgi:hypothetical protein
MKIKKFNESKDTKAKYPEKVLSFHDIKSDNQRLKNIYNSYCGEGRLKHVYGKIFEKPEYDHILNSIKYNL